MATYGEQIQSAVAAQIRAELGVAKMSQAELARAVGVHPATISRALDPDDPRDIRWDDFAEIAKALGLSPHELALRAERRMGGEGA